MLFCKRRFTFPNNQTRMFSANGYRSLFQRIRCSQCPFGRFAPLLFQLDLRTKVERFENRTRTAINQLTSSSSKPFWWISSGTGSLLTFTSSAASAASASFFSFFIAFFFFFTIFVWRFERNHGRNYIVHQLYKMHLLSSGSNHRLLHHVQILFREFSGFEKLQSILHLCTTPIRDKRGKGQSFAEPAAWGTRQKTRRVFRRNSRCARPAHTCWPSSGWSCPCSSPPPGQWTSSGRADRTLASLLHKAQNFIARRLISLERLPFVLSARNRAFSAPRIWMVEAGYLARFVRLPAFEIRRAPTCTKWIVDATNSKNNWLSHRAIDEQGQIFMYVGVKFFR